MAKKSDEGLGVLILIGVVIAPFVWLYNAVGEFWFWVIVIGVPALVITGWFLNEQEKTKVSSTRLATRNISSSATSQPEDVGYSWNSAWIEHCEKIENAWENGDYEWVRQELQRIAYSMVGKSVTQEEKDKFTQVMTEFASEDPLYRDVMQRLLPMVRAKPGLTQSHIYKGQPDEVKEQMRYVLYFAHELGHIHRIKKGNSYKLYPPGMTVSSE